MQLPRWSASFAVAAIAALTGAPTAAAQEAYEPAPRGTRILESGSGLVIRMLVEASNLGGDEVEIGEIVFPAGSKGGEHVHERVEIFYVLEGTFDHIVNGEAYRLEPGGVGVVRPGDRVIHRVVGDRPVRALVIWAPGGEADRIAPAFEERPVDPPPPGDAGVGR